MYCDQLRTKKNQKYFHSAEVEKKRFLYFLHFRKARATFTVKKTIFRGFSFVFVYVKRLLISLLQKRNNVYHLRQIFHLLHENSSTHRLINKCLFFHSSLDFLGFNVSPAGLFTTFAKKTEISSYYSPTDYASLPRFLRILGFTKLARTVCPFLLIWLKFVLPSLFQYGGQTKLSEFFKEMQVVFSSSSSLPFANPNVAHLDAGYRLIFNSNKSCIASDDGRYSCTHQFLH